jgi:carboxypeptidase C (cathepsin A)
MPATFTHRLLAAFFVLALGCTVHAQAAAEKSSGDASDKAKPIPEPQSFVTQHSGKFNGKNVRYTVTAGETYLRDKQGEPKATIFTFAYTGQAQKGEVRPVTFVWNGGPGSASHWLHMGAYGPRRIFVPSAAEHPGSAPFTIVDAPETILDVTDLVFVDPVGTGFSRALGEHEGREFWGLKEDARSLAEFIQIWTTQNGR